MIKDLTQNTPIVTVAYNRPKSLLRLLGSLNNANYPNKDIPLIISIDQNDSNNEVLEVANNFKWAHGKKEVRYQVKNLGLKNHIIKCGKISYEYGSVIILEDDLYVSKSFYYYTIEALKFTSNKSYVGGVSLYNHKLNQHIFSDFSCVEDEYDNWYFQYAASWGQAWTSLQFQGFLNWFDENHTLSLKPFVPKSVLDWSDKSWLKFYITYLIENNKYFIYPKISHTTNFGDTGTHFDYPSTTYQVPLSYSEIKTFTFSEIEKSKSVYDAFYENIGLYTILNLKQDELCIDLYGHKPNYNQKKYYLTSKILDYKIVKSFARGLRPIEANIIENIKGNELFLYDTTIELSNKSKKNKLSNLLYNYRAISYQSSIYLAIKLTKQRILTFLSAKK